MWPRKDVLMGMLEKVESIEDLALFLFSSRRRHTRFKCDWVQTCALPIWKSELLLQGILSCDSHLGRDLRAARETAHQVRPIVVSVGLNRPLLVCRNQAAVLFHPEDLPRRPDVSPRQRLPSRVPHVAGHESLRFGSGFVLTANAFAQR